MKERSQNLQGQKERDDATLNSLNYHAQEAILDPNLPEVYKDQILDLAIHTIQKVGERRANYHAKYGEGRRTIKQK
jgi:hypothetical protein